MGMDPTTAARQSRASAICDSLGRLHGAVDRLGALRTEIQQGAQGETGIDSEKAPTPPLAELLEKLPLELSEIASRIDGLLGDMSDLLI